MISALARLNRRYPNDVYKLLSRSFSKWQLTAVRLTNTLFILKFDVSFIRGRGRAQRPKATQHSHKFIHVKKLAIILNYRTCKVT